MPLGDPPRTDVGRGPGIEHGFEIDQALGEIAAEVDQRYESEFGRKLGGKILDGFAKAFNRSSRE